MPEIKFEKERGGTGEERAGAIATSKTAHVRDDIATCQWMCI